ncbi:hypothetical protein [Calidithermus chliarophilus]|uniref:hypothetical protein n=1 Tax=Calidithermus chliarophilus TaxID=52023 RepID=UPI00041A7532|nr:hypothetical protein [Calidithermus chliarophilus]
MRGALAPASASAPAWACGLLWEHLIRWPEWLNAADHPALVGAVLEAARRMPPDLAVRAVRAGRPRGEANSREATAWWAQHKGLTLYGLLARAGSVAEVEAELGFSPSQLYHLLKDWGVRFLALPAPKESAQGHLAVYEGELSHAAGGYWLTTPAGLRLRVRLTGWGSWIALDDPGPVVLGSHAVRIARHAGVNRLRSDLVPLLRQVGRARGLQVLPHPRLEGEWLIPERLLEEVFGREAVARGRDALNPCQCVFYDPALGGCGLGHKDLKGPRCVDHHGLS